MSGRRSSARPRRPGQSLARDRPPSRPALCERRLPFPRPTASSALPAAQRGATIAAPPRKATQENPCLAGARSGSIRAAAGRPRERLNVGVEELTYGGAPISKPLRQHFDRPPLRSPKHAKRPFVDSRILLLKNGALQIGLLRACDRPQSPPAANLAPFARLFLDQRQGDLLGNVSEHRADDQGDHDDNERVLERGRGDGAKLVAGQGETPPSSRIRRRRPECRSTSATWRRTP